MTRFSAAVRALLIASIYIGVCALSTIPLPLGSSGHKLCFLDANCTVSGTWTYSTPLAYSNLPNLGAARLLANPTAGNAAPAGTTWSAFLDAQVTPAQGQLCCYRAVSSWAFFPPGNSGQVVQSTGGGNPQWASTKAPLMANSSATQAAASTLFYPCNGSSVGGSATEADVQAPLPYAGTVVEFGGFSNAVAGSGNTWTGTLRKNGSDTTLTCSFTGVIGQNCSDTAHTVTFALNDKCSVKWVSSAIAAPLKIANSEELDTP